MPSDIFNKSSCLSQRTLSDYHLGKLDRKATHSAEAHLVDCELCSMALAGFALVPVSDTDMQDLHRRIDASTSKGPGLFSSKIIMTGIAAMAITGSFLFYNIVFKETTVVEPVMLARKSEENAASQPAIVSLPEVIAVTAVPEDIKDKTVATKKAKTIFPKENFTGTVEGTVEKVKTDPVVDPVVTDKKVVEKPAVKEPEEKIVEPEYNAPVTYVCDLKITDYQRFYFKDISQAQVRTNNVPAPFENKLSKSMDGEELVRTQLTTDILNKGLMYFKDKNFKRANEQFAVLIEQNKNDVNALFYGGLSFYSVDKNDMAVKYFDRVLLSPNNVFHPEAQWYKALALLKKGDKENARQAFELIVSEKGFYAKQAREKLKEGNIEH